MWNEYLADGTVSQCAVVLPLLKFEREVAVVPFFFGVVKRVHESATDQPRIDNDVLQVEQAKKGKLRAIDTFICILW